MMSVWVAIFSIVGPIGLVICICDHGHLALEFSHEGQSCEAPSGSPNTIADNDFDGCTDTPIFAYLGRLRTTTLPVVSGKCIVRYEGHFSRINNDNYDTGAIETNLFHLAPDRFLQDLLTTIIIC